MQVPVLTSENGVTVTGGGEITRQTLVEALTHAPDLVAADGAAGTLRGFGLTPRAVVGDFDSLDEATRAALDPATLHHVPEQNSTDFEKCLTRVEAPLILAVGFMGKRPDHELAVYNAIVRHSGLRAGARRVIVVGETDVCLHVDGALSLDLPVGTRVSLFPMAKVRGVSRGLKWPIAGIPFASDGRIGTSNEMAAERLEIEMDGAGMLMFLPRAALGSVVAALRAL
ncbi:thiamine diphosphokinase [Celeribacter sp.]|uniref:thiamine diphosphokinase n=1 Tax=Celeribacter sp. TaxID=1890673 RepID=UPI003A91AE1B